MKDPEYTAYQYRDGDKEIVVSGECGITITVDCDDINDGWPDPQLVADAIAAMMNATTFKTYGETHPRDD